MGDNGGNMIGIAVRWALTIGMLCMVSTEVGPWTLLTLVLLTARCEVTDMWLAKMVREGNAIMKEAVGATKKFVAEMGNRPA